MGSISSLGEDCKQAQKDGWMMCCQCYLGGDAPNANASANAMDPMRALFLLFMTVCVNDGSPGSDVIGSGDRKLSSSPPY